MTEVNPSSLSGDDDVVDEYGFRPGQDAVGENTDGVFSPADEPVAVTDFGTTKEETLHGEHLEGRLARELPDETSESTHITEQGATGTLVDSDNGALSDTEKDVVAHDAGFEGGSQSAEEAAMHIIPE